MDRRTTLVALPGLAALAASRAFADAPVQSPSPSAGTVSKKALLKHSGPKAAYKIPKSATKQTKYVNSLTALLQLTAGQQQQIAAIIAAAGSVKSSIRANVKAVRRTLSSAVNAGDSAAVSQASSVIGTLKGQNISNGASAHAAIFQVLTPTQQATLSQLVG